MLANRGPVGTAILAGAFGLVGVIVGGFVSVWADRSATRRRERADARVAARLVIDELAALVRGIEFAKRYESVALFVDEPPFTGAMWHEHRATLARLLPSEEWREVSESQVSLVEQIRVAENSARRPPGVAPDPDALLALDAARSSALHAIFAIERSAFADPSVVRARRTAPG